MNKSIISISFFYLVVNAWVALSVWPAAADTATNLICSSCVGSSDLANGAVTRSKIRNFAVNSSKLAGSAVAASKIANGAVVRSRIRDFAVNGSKLAGSAVSTAKIANGTIAQADLGFAAATADDIDLLMTKMDNLAQL